MSEARSAALRFEMDAPSGRLTALFEPGDEAAPSLDRDAVIDALGEAGWAALHRDDAAIERLLQAAGAGQSARIDIAERRDATCAVELADDAMSAMLTLTLAYGGAEVTRDEVERALEDAGVVCGVLEREIDQALAQQAVVRRVVARGRAPQPGQPARFDSLIPDIRQRGPSVDARGIVDYRELGTLVTVHAGDPLMRRTPATPGVDGENLRGERVPAAPGADTPFADDLHGASPSPDDPDLLLADIAGQPLLRPHGVVVEPTISIPAVDLQSGNIDFDGTVKVTGDVTAGMHVRATGDVIVSGTVEAAQVEAGGNITVAAGVIGVADGSGPGAGSKARLVAAGSVSVLFCENSVIDAGIDILVGEVALHSELTADNGIVIGKPGARRSQLIGGVARATALLKVGVLGSPAGVHTHVEVGYRPHAYAQLAAVEAELAENEKRLESLGQVIGYTETLDDAHHRELNARARRTLVATEAAHAELLDRRADARASLQIMANARVVVGQQMHPGVDVRLGEQTTHLREPAGAGVLVLHDGEIMLAAE